MSIYSPAKKKLLSFLLLPDLFQFLQEEALRLGTSRTEILNTSLRLYKKYRLKKNIEEGFKSQTEEDTQLAMSDFNDYYSIINSEVK
jgi:hypothetical protein